MLFSRLICKLDGQVSFCCFRHSVGSPNQQRKTQYLHYVLLIYLHTCHGGRHKSTILPTGRWLQEVRNRVHVAAQYPAYPTAQAEMKQSPMDDLQSPFFGSPSSALRLCPWFRYKVWGPDFQLFWAVF